MWQSAFSFREGGKRSTGTTMQMMRGDQSGPYMVSEDSQEKFVGDFVEAWDKVMNLDRFDLK